ncbi:MAG: tetratricopeptide repeat protein [Candidatus Solibacter sp.]|nr:tetratricopeptide repeat protein [Candidatus Solibacter sp.]
MNLAWILRTLLLGCLLCAPLAAQQTTITEASLLAGLERDSKDLGAYIRLHQWYLKQGRATDAEQLFQRAVNAIPLSVFAPGKPQALAVGDFFLIFGKLDQALQQYRAGVTDSPGEKPTYLKRQIEVLLRQGKRSEAVELNAQILRENPNDNDARGLAASLLLDKGDVNGALAELQVLAVRAPENPVIHFNLGRAHAARSEWEAAKREFNRSIELRPDYLPPRLALAQTQVTRGEFDEAWKTAAAALALDAGNQGARLMQSAALMGQKKFGESRQALDEMLKADPASADANFQLGVLGLAEKKYPEAEAAFRRAYQLNPANSRGLMGIVEATLAQNKNDAALALLQAEADKSPNRTDLQLALGTTALRVANHDLAIATFQKLLSQMEKGSASQGDLYIRLGEAYHRKGDNLAAIQALEKARQMLPNNVAVMGALAVVLDALDRKTEASEAYEAALKLDPNNAMAINNFAFLLAETGGDLGRALAMVHRARQLQPNLVEITDTLGWIYVKMGMADNAIETLRDLVDKNPDRPIYRYHLAVAYQLKGDKAAALAEARAAADRHPPEKESRQIQALIGQLGGGK